ncbi:CoA transferase [Saccharothrix sp. Mg75]|uniref:CoA transferase n=1 Tax=Saccharothrix sp. Mg75 TaxID=3445357 RepID=UPI003EF05270
MTTRTARRPAAPAVPWAGPVDLPLAGELDVQAACGLMHVHGRRFGRPTPLGLDYASVVAAELAATGVAAAGLGYLRGLPPRAVRTSVAQAALLAVSPHLATATADDPEGPFHVGGPPFVSADGVAFEVETTDAGAWQRFWTALGVEPRTARVAWRAYAPRHTTATCPLPPALTAVAARTPVEFLERVAAATRVPLVRVARRVLDHVPARDLRPQAPAPHPLRPATGSFPLSGLVVLESCTRLHGSLAGQLLRHLGATVIRVEPPGGDPRRDDPPRAAGVSAHFHALNRGKRSVGVDQATVAGRRELLELVSAVDVLLHDWAPRAAPLRPRDAARANPGLVQAHAAGHLDGHPHAVGESAAQARAGVPDSLMALVETYGAVVCAHGVVEALVHRARTDTGHVVTTSLLGAASRLNSRAARRDTAPLTAEVRTDLAALARDDRFARVITRDGCAVPTSPWEFA